MKGNRPDLNVEEFLGTSIYPIVSQPDRVDSFLVHLVGDTQRKPDFPQRFIIATGPALTPEQIQLLAGWIRDPGSYFFARKRCAPHPDFALRLWQGDAWVDMLICFYCCDWVFYTQQHREWVGCDPVRRELLRLAKSLFPEEASPSARSVWKQGAIKRLVESSER
jgi:hypothetical protein